MRGAPVACAGRRGFDRMRPSQLARVLEEEYRSAESGHHTPVMIWGPPGVGKSQIVSQIADHHSAPMIDIRLSQMEPSDLRGIPFRTQDTVEWAIPSMLPDAQRHGPHGILFLDEITSAAPTVSAAAYQLILDRRLGRYQVPPGWAIFAAGNRQGDRGVSYVMPSPLANRFSHFEIEVHLDDWAVWAYGQRIDDRVIGFLRLRPELLFDFDAEHNPSAFPTPRSWEFAHRALRKFESDPSVLGETLQACVGPVAGMQLHAFVQHAAELPDPSDVLEGKDMAVPESIDLQYAVAAALVGRVIRAKGEARFSVALGAVLTYAGRFPQQEIGVMLVCDLMRGLGEEIVCKAPEFKPWADQVAELLIYD